MKTAIKVTSVILRISELICASIVVGILGRYMYLLHLASAGHGSRIVYSLSLGSISLFFSLIFVIPLKFTFFAFLLDLALFIMWMVAFGLMEDLTGTDTCSSYWYWYSWGYYWGRWWHTVPVTAFSPTLVGSDYCGRWRATLAFSFIGGWLWLVSGILGLCVCLKLRRDARDLRTRAGITADEEVQNGTKHEEATAL